MSFIIKGIDLPNSGEIELIIRPHGKVLSKTRGIYAEAIQVPKDARLIDANKLEIHRCDDSASRATFDYVDEWDLEDAPTILESEEEE